MTNRDWQRWFPEDRDEKPGGPPNTNRTVPRVMLIIGGLLIIFILVSIGRGIYAEWLWFSSLGYSNVYGTIIKARAAVFFIAAIFFCLLLLANLVLATRLVPKTATHYWHWSIVQGFQKAVKWSVISGATITALIFGLVAQGNWQLFLRFFNAQPFGIADPVFNKEVSFYVFTLPFLQFIHGWLLAALIITFLGTAGIYFLSHTVQNCRLSTGAGREKAGSVWVVLSTGWSTPGNSET